MLGGGSYEVGQTLQPPFLYLLPFKSDTLSPAVIKAVGLARMKR